MARCYICKRSAAAGNSRSHSNIASKRKFKINLQSKKIDGVKRTVCAKCLKTMNKVK
ncbi:MAG: bL28 family ribosomal protein [Candidatus Moranbacteria bacterium]|nr:bL28 family ribosomal protein [Candidatus Moranbacteria bacterium]